MKPAGRTLAEFQPLKSGEQKLLDACRTGELCQLEEGRPEQATEDNIVHAAFVRFLALGGDEEAPVHEHGVQLAGAWIEGLLDLQGAQVVANLGLFNCEFCEQPVLLGACIRDHLFLFGSRLPGLNAERLVCEGNVFLTEVMIAGEVRLLGAQVGGNLVCGGARLDGKDSYALMTDGAVIKGNVFLSDGFSATGEVRLLSTQIGGNLVCSGARLDGKDGSALSADGAVIKGNVLLNKGFSATGEARLLSTQIGGNLYCGGATLDGKKGYALSADGAIIKGSVLLNKEFSAIGTVRLLSAQIGGDLNCNGAKFDGKKSVALSADGMNVAGSFFLRDMPDPVHGISLNHAQAGRLIDDKKAWGERLVLDGFVYGSFAGGAPTDAVTRIAWLDKQSKSEAGLDGGGADFRPQPWRQLQEVLREMGHVEDARQVAIAFEHRLYRAGLIGQTPAHWGQLRSGLYRTTVRAFHKLFWILIGFGYRPLRLAMWMLSVWLLCAGLFWYAALQGVFAPSNPLVFQHPAYAACVPGSAEATAELAKPANANPPPVPGAGNWYLCTTLREEYTGFSPLAYSLGVLLPLVDLGQEDAWSTLIPTPQASWYKELFAWDLKRATRFAIWFEILFGWVSSLLLVAVVSGLTKRRED